MKKSLSGRFLQPSIVINVFLTLALIFLLIPNVSSPVQADSISPFSGTQSDGKASPPLLEEDNGGIYEEEGSRQAEPIETRQIVEPDNDTEITSGNGNISLRIPSGTINQTAEFTIKQHIYGGSAGLQMVNVFEFTAEESSSKSQISSFKKELQLTIRHTEAELAGLDIDSLGLYYLDEN